MARLIATSCWTAIEWLDSIERVSSCDAEVLEVPRGLAMDAPPVDAAGRRAARGRA